MPLPPSALEDVLRIAIVPGVGPARVSALLARFGSVAGVLAATPAEVAAMPGFGPELARRVASASAAEGGARAREALRTLGDVGAVALTAADEAYPQALRALPDPPFVLYAVGDPARLARPGLGIVGTRSPTEYGRRAAGRLAFDLARAGYAVVSGLARGIDAAAHAAALDAGGATVGVLGHGVDQVYPLENRDLFRRVREHGVLLTELAPGEPPLAGNFPRRNRLIAALSAGVLVVEMGERSGARHTVDYALELGREVFSVPGPIGSPASAGTNQLLKEGARLVTCAADILEELQGVGVAPPDGSGEGPPPAPPHPALSPEEGRVLQALGTEPRHIDEVAVSLSLSTAATLATLLSLELHALAEALPGKHFRLR